MTLTVEILGTPMRAGHPAESSAGVDTVRTPRPRRPVAPDRSGLVAVLGGALVVALVASAMIYSIASETSLVASVGNAAVYEEATLSAAAAARNGTVQAQLIGRAYAVGLATEEELARSLAQAEEARDELVRRADRTTVEMEDSGLAQPVGVSTLALVSAIDEALALIRDESFAAADAVIGADLEDAYEALAVVLVDARDRAIARMALSGKEAGRLAAAARFLVALALPLAVLKAFRSRVRIAQRRRDLEHQLEQQQAITKTKDEFIANLSHELRTPLTGIYGFALELIDDETRQDPMLSAELARLIAGESAELSRMVEDLLSAASAEQDGLVVALGEVDPAIEVDAVLDPVAAMGITFDSRIDHALITADRFRLRQIIRNLVSNARRHGGPDISVIGRREATEYVIEVRDNGPGVPAEVEQRMFTRFVHEGKAPLITGSVGLGLAIAWLLVDRMNGTLSYRREGHETVFAARFPLVESEGPRTVEGSGTVVLTSG